MQTISQRWVDLLFSVIEGGIVFFIIMAFWHHSPPIRDNWVWLLWLAVPIFYARYRIFGRLWTETPMQIWMIFFLLVSYFSFTHAPYARQDFLVLICRPLAGMWLYVYMTEQVRLFKSLRGVIILTIGMASVVALLAVTATNWEATKSAPFSDLIAALPRFDYRQLAQSWNQAICLPFSDWVIGQPCFQTGDVISNLQFGFNPNEIAGVLAWIIPVMGAVALGNHVSDKGWIGIRIGAGIVGGLGLLGLFIGQSRFAIFGVLLALAIVIVLIASGRRKQMILLAGIAILFSFEASLVLNLFPTPSSSTTDVGLSGRDERTFTNRFDLWDRGIQMLMDYPATGIGIYMYRTATGVEPYTIPYYVAQNTTPPHAHNEWVHVAAEMGIFGLIAFVAWQACAAWMIWQGWKSNSPEIRLLAVAGGAALIAHGVYGIGDAVTLWDRYQFVLWWIYALIGAQYVQFQNNKDVNPS